MIILKTAAAVPAHANSKVKVRRIVVITQPENRGSITLLEKIGMRFEQMIPLAEDAKELTTYGPAEPAARA